MKISMIAAISLQGALGKENKMLWHLPNDLKHFKKMTMNKPVIMGRKTFESIGTALPGRVNIIVTRKLNYKVKNAIIVSSPEAALNFAKSLIKVDEVVVIGGGEIYEYLISFADNLYMTVVETELKGDAYFPDNFIEDWEKTESIYNKADDKHEFNYAFINYKRKT